MSKRFASATRAPTAPRLSAALIACALAGCSNQEQPEPEPLLAEQLGFPILAGLVPCTPEMVIVEDNRESAVCFRVQDDAPGAAHRLISEYSDLATSSGWTPERIDQDRAYFVRGLGDCPEQLMIFLADDEDGEQSIVFGLDRSSREVTTALGAARGEPSRQDGCGR